MNGGTSMCWWSATTSRNGIKAYSYPVRNEKAETVAEKFVSEFVCRFGVPAELHSERGRNFESKVFAEVCNLLGIKKTCTTPYNPKSDEMIERFNS